MAAKVINPPCGVDGRVVAPYELLRGAEALVAPGQRGVDDVLAITAHRDEAAVGVVRQGLRVQVAAAQVLCRQRQPLAIRLYAETVRQRMQAPNCSHEREMGTGMLNAQAPCCPRDLYDRTADPALAATHDACQI